MPDWGRRLSQLGRLSAVIAGAVWGYRLVRKKRASMSLQELLSLFRSEDIAHCLRERGLPTSGTKQERIDRLIGMAARLDEQAGWSASNVLECFRQTDLRRVSRALDIEAADKASMVKALATLVAAVR